MRPVCRDNRCDLVLPAIPPKFQRQSLHHFSRSSCGFVMLPPHGANGMAVNNSVNTNVNKCVHFCSFFMMQDYEVDCVAAAPKRCDQKVSSLCLFFFATWFPQLHLHHNSISYLKCKTKLYWSRNRQWYKSVHLLLAANRGFGTTQCSSSPCPHFTVSLKEKEKQSDNYHPFKILVWALYFTL